MLTASDLWYRHRRGDDWVLAGASLDVAPGEIVGLRGDSGVGKTTLARVLAGYLPARRGAVAVDGAPLPVRGVRPVQLVLQHPELAVDPRWRLDEVLAEAGPLDGDLLDALSISPAWLRRHPHELSGGELQRVAVARALAARPRYLVADEVSAMLDPITQAQLWAVLRERAARGGLGILAVSHDRDLLDVVADRVVTLADGSVRATASLPAPAPV